MNLYKKIIKSKKLRVKILEFLKFIPDKWMIKIQYKVKTGNKLNLKDPKRYTEKLQWYKLYYRNPKMKECADKFEVRNYLKERGLEKILNELYGVYDSPDEIKLDDLPEKFVLKTTNGCGTNIFCYDKNKFDIEKARIKIKEWMKIETYEIGREWSYSDTKPKIICEKLLERDKNNDLPDYKFFCFDGRVYCLYTMVDYVDNHEEGKLGFFDRNFKDLNVRRLDFKEIDREIEKPKNFEKMVEYAEILSKDFPHVRVDFYNINGKIIFGEMTFYNASGYTKFYPDDFDYKMGREFNLRKYEVKQ